jgi:hypothetical protein
MHVMATNNKKPKNWLELKNIVEKSRKITQTLNCNVPVNIKFRDFTNAYGLNECRIYYLGNTARGEATIKYVDVLHNQKVDVLEENSLFNNNTQFDYPDKNTQQLTKEEQLLRERKRCSFNGITSYAMDEASSGRLIFSERSSLFYFDDPITVCLILNNLHDIKRSLKA